MTFDQRPETIAAARMTLRPIVRSDADAIFDCVNEKGFMRYMYHWQGESMDDVKRFVDYAVSENAAAGDGRAREYACILNDTGALCACVSLRASDGDASLGWFGHHALLGKRYVTEAVGALIDHAFSRLHVRRVTAQCDARNERSIALMERLHMRREGVAAEARPMRAGDERPGDEVSYAMLASEWEDWRDIASLMKTPVVFDDFMDVPELTDGDIRVICSKKTPANPEKKYVPAYVFLVTRGGEAIGHINLRIGYANRALYHGGQIGYGMDEKYRGHGYMAAACRLIVPVMRFHGMTFARITNNVENTASRRVCEKLGAELLRVSRVPEWHDMYKDGSRYVNIFEWRFGEGGAV